MPRAHLLWTEGVAQFSCLVASDGLLEPDVELVDASDASMVPPQLFQPPGIIPEVEDPVEDDVVSQVQRLAGDGVDERGGVGGSRRLLAAGQKRAPEVVLMDDRGLAAEQRAQRRRRRRLARAGVAAQHDEASVH